MPRSFALVIALATLGAPALAQNAYLAGPHTNGPYTQYQAAPVERHAGYGPPANSGPRNGSTSTQVIPGVWLRVGPNSMAQTVNSGPDRVELRVERGRANVEVRQPDEHPEILVDLPGGQTAILKDGLYTFNADTNTMRVVRGEADAFPGNGNTAVPVGEYHEMAFGAQARARIVGPHEARADVLPFNYGENQRADGRSGGTYSDGRRGDGPYPAPYPYYAYPYPYVAYGYGWPYGYYRPWGYYPSFGFGLGFGYYGGRYGYGGYRGGYFRR